MIVLKLTLKKKWFDLIKSGEKTEEYREIKPYWANRLTNFDWKDAFTQKYVCLSDLKDCSSDIFNQFDAIQFTNGYATNSPRFTIECLGICIGVGNPEWGAPPEHVFIIKLGKIIENGTN